MTPRDLDAWETLALAQLPKMAADYYAGGARDEVTVADNRAAWRAHWLVHRVLAGVAAPDPSASAFGLDLRAPVVVAPTAFHALAHPDGEVETARGVAAAGSAMVLSTLSTAPVEDVAAAAGGRIAFQLYVYKDRGLTAALVERVRAAGCRALVVTVDAAILGTRHRDVANGFHLPPWLRLPNALPLGGGLDRTDGSSLAAFVHGQLDPALSWSDLDHFAATAGLPVWVKGVVRGDDARRAVDGGAAGVVVSNHGGRQLDRGVPTAAALPGVVAAVGGRAPVWVDGGVRRGADVIVARALGADGVLVGRPALWGLAAGGAGGVAAVLDQLRAEVVEALHLLGEPSARGLGPHVLTPRLR